jgi:hypothetical protein
MAGLTRTDYTALKSAMIIDDDISYDAMIIKFTKTMERTVVMSSNSHNVPTTTAFAASTPSILGKRTHDIFDQFYVPRHPNTPGAPPQAMISPVTPQF